MPLARRCETKSTVAGAGAANAGSAPVALVVADHADVKELRPRLRVDEPVENHYSMDDQADSANLAKSLRTYSP